MGLLRLTPTHLHQLCHGSSPTALQILSLACRILGGNFVSNEGFLCDLSVLIVTLLRVQLSFTDQLYLTREDF